MADFAVLGTAENELLRGAIERHFRDAHFHIAEHQWVVADTGATAERVAEKIGADGRSGEFVVFSVAGYFGYHRKDLWEWLTLNSG